MGNPQQSRLYDLTEGCLLRISFSFFFVLLFSLPSWSQKNEETRKDTVYFDTIPVRKGTLFRYNGKTYKVKKDTVFIVETSQIPTIELKSVRRSNIFYDSVYKKFSRKKIFQVLYTMAFKPPELYALPGNAQQIKSEVPFEKYKGKVIRHIKIKTLSPFGTSIYDTLAESQTAVGRDLNAAHMNTRNFVIRKNLFFKEGQIVDPYILADNERNLREMSFIDNVRTIIISPRPSSDSVDIIIIVKDVFSIGFDVINANTNRANFRLYDGNFLGLADRLSTSYSFKTKREPFFRIDAASYSYSNIAGTFLNTLITYTLDDIGNQSLSLSLNRNFYSINTKWALGAGYGYSKMIQEIQNKSEQNEVLNIPSYYDDFSLWGGRGFRIKNANLPSRFVITESLYNRYFTSRPVVSIDSNKAYYNTSRILTGFAYSANSYYLSDYFQQFGKIENIPYGQAVKVTLGPEKNDFYTRLYGGIDVSAGNFFNNLGYFYGRAVIGGYFYHKSTEDCVLKTILKYFTPLLTSTDKKFKFRAYLNADYRFGFNFRNNNLDYSNINHDLLIDQVKYDTVFQGRKSLSSTLTLIMYTPLYFYGFRFAFILQGKAGLVAQASQNLIHQPLNTGVGIGIIIKNDNLIFPSFLISLFYYPSVPSGVTWWQFRFDQSTGITLPDFNVTMPQTENLQN